MEIQILSEIIIGNHLQTTPHTMSSEPITDVPPEWRMAWQLVAVERMWWCEPNGSSVTLEFLMSEG
jgi:hypothetical protein